MTIQNAAEDVESQGFLFGAGGNANLCNYFGRPFVVSNKLNIFLSYSAAIDLFYLPKYE